MKLPRKKRDENSATIPQALGLILFLSGLLVATSFAAVPAWWSSSGTGTQSAVVAPQVVTNNGIVTTNYVPNNYAIVTQGQLKQFTTRAVDALNTGLTNYGGAGTNLTSLVEGWEQDYATNGYATNTANPTRPYKPSDFQVENVGQLKYVGNLVWAQLVAAGYTNAAPSWLAQNTNTDHGVANLGQLKEVFNFDFTLDSDGSGLPDWWEIKYFGQLGESATADPDGNGFTLLQDYQGGANPTNYYSQPGPVTITPTLTIVSGNNQTSALNAFAPQPLVVQVTNSNGGAVLANAPVTFTVASGGGQVAATSGGTTTTSLSLTTDSNGNALVYYQAGSTSSPSNTITATTGSGAGSTSVVFTVTTQSTSSAIAAGEGFTVALKPNGTVWAWGTNNHGQLGNGTTTGFQMPQQVPGLCNVVQISVTGSHVLALKSDNTLWAWGANDQGQLGNGTTTDQDIPQQVTLPSGTIQSIAAGGYSSFVLMADGTVYGWGGNTQGQLGDGTTSPETAPEQIMTAGSGFTALAAGYNNTVALKGDGTVWITGSNASQQDGSNFINGLTFVPVAGISNVTAVAVGDAHVVALQANGTVWGWGSDIYGSLGDGQFNVTTPTPQQIGSLNNAVSVFASGGSTFILFNDGSLQDVGGNNRGQLGLGNTTNQNQLQQPSNLPALSGLAASHTHTIALTQAGALIGWGNNSTYQLGSTFPVHWSTSAQALDTNDYTYIACGKDFQVFANSGYWALGVGDNHDGQLGLGDNTSYPTIQFNDPLYYYYISEVFAGAHHAFFTDTGTLLASGDNSDGQLGNGTTTNQNTPVAISFSNPNVLGSASYIGGSVAGGERHSLAVMSDGSVTAWGNNAHGQLGDGTTIGETLPESILGLSNIVQVSAGGDRSFALDSSGNVWAWGENANGELGLGTTGDVSTPTQIPNLPPMRAIAASESFTMALDTSGNIWTWGGNSHGQLGNGTTQSNEMPTMIQGLYPMVAIAAGGHHAVAIQNNHSVWTWGANADGQLGNGTFNDSSTPAVVPHISDVKLIGAGENFTSLIKNDGTLEGFGDTSSGQLAVNIALYDYSPTTVLGFSMTDALPQVSISQPTNGTVVAGNQNLALQASANANGSGSIAQVVYFVGGDYVGQSTSPDGSGLFDANWILPAVTSYGDYTITAITYNSDGVATMASPISVYLSDDQAGDGLPDWWENEYFGGTGYASSSSPDGNGLTLLQDYEQGNDPTNYYSQNGQTITPILTIVSGNNQSSAPGNFTPQPLIVQVTDSNNNPLVNAPVTFTVTSGGGQLATSNTGTPQLSTSIQAVTDSNGQAEVYFQQPASSPAISQISAVAGDQTVNFAEISGSESVPVPAVGLVSWMKADAGVTSDTNSNVSQWADQTGNYTVTQSNCSNEPSYVGNDFNGEPALRFNGNQWLSNCALVAGMNADCTIIEVGMTSVPDDKQYSVFIGNGNAYQNRSIGYLSDQELYDSYNGYALIGSTPNPYALTAEMATLDPTLTTVTFYQNGGETGTGTVSGLQNVSPGLTLGDNVNEANGWQGDIAEVLVYDRRLSSNELAQVDGYLADKYGYYSPNATWPEFFSSDMQALIIANQWTEQQATAYASFVAANPNPPVPVPGLQLWLKADAGLSTDTNNNVLQWTDQSPWAHVIGQSTQAGSPVLQADSQGNPTLRFNGNQALYGSDYVPANGDVSIVTVEEADNTQNFTMAFSLGGQPNEGSTRAYAYKNGEAEFDVFGNGVLAGNTANPGEEAVNTVTYQRSSGNVDFYLRGSANGTGNIGVNDLSNGVVIGDGAAYNNPWTGTVSEILVYNHVLCRTERNQVEGYLADKYGIYSSNATWLEAYTSEQQAEIALHQWDKTEANNYVALENNNPTMLTHGLTLWLKADEGVMTDGSGNVNAWADQTGNYPVTQSNSGNDPTYVSSDFNGEPAVRFNGNQWLNNSALVSGINADCTIIEVGMTTTPGNQEYSIYLGTGGANPYQNRAIGYLSDQEIFDSYDGYALVGSAPNANFLTSEIATLNPTLTTVTFYQNGSETGTGTLSGLQNVSPGITLGTDGNNDNGWQGDIAEVLVYDHQLSSAEVAQVDGYLADKYGYYSPNATWPLAYSSDVQTLITANQWNEAQANDYVNILQTLQVASGLTAWFRADVGVTTTNGSVTQWNDQSLNGYNITQSAGSSAPTYGTDPASGLPVVQFNGNQWISSGGTTLSSVNDVTIITVASTPTPGGSEAMVDIGTGYDSLTTRALAYSGGDESFVNGEPNGGYAQFNNGGPADQTTQLTLNEVTYSNSAGQANFYSNGVADGSVSVSTGTISPGLSLGSLTYYNNYYGWNGNIAEVVIYDRVLSTTERQEVEGYLADKYGVYSPTATWPLAYSSEVQALIMVNQWNESQTNAYVDSLAPAAASNLTAQIANSSEIDLAWTNNENAGDATAILVQQQNSDGSWSTIAPLGPGQSSYAITGLTLGTTYNFQIVTANANGQAAAALSAPITLGAPAAPSGLTVTDGVPGEIDLSWTNNANNASSIVIEESTDGVTWIPIATLPSTQASYTVTGLTPDQGYYYTISSENNSGDNGATVVSTDNSDDPADNSNAQPVNATAALYGVIVLDQSISGGLSPMFLNNNGSVVLSGGSPTAYYFWKNGQLTTLPSNFVPEELNNNDVISGYVNGSQTDPASTSSNTITDDDPPATWSPTGGESIQSYPPLPASLSGNAYPNLNGYPPLAVSASLASQSHEGSVLIDDSGTVYLSVAGSYNGDGSSTVAGWGSNLYLYSALGFPVYVSCGGPAGAFGTPSSDISSVTYTLSAVSTDYIIFNGNVDVSGVGETINATAAGGPNVYIGTYADGTNDYGVFTPTSSGPMYSAGGAITRLSSNINLLSINSAGEILAYDSTSNELTCLNSSNDAGPLPASALAACGQSPQWNSQHQMVGNGYLWAPVMAQTTNYSAAVNSLVSPPWTGVFPHGIKDLNDSGAIVGTATYSGTNTAIAAGSHGVMLLPLQITNVISDQLHGVEVNKFPTPFAGSPSDDPNNPMIMSARTGTTGYIAAVVTNIPSSFLPKMLLGVRQAGTTTVLASTPIVAAPGRTYLSFPATDGQNLYEVVAGYDSNGNGVLDSSEVSVNFGSTDGRHNRTFVITADDYSGGVSTLGALTSVSSTIFGGVAANLLGTFLNPTQTPSGASATTTDLFSTETIHPLGATWSTNGDDNTVHFYTFPSASSVSQEAAASTGVHQLIAGAITDLGANSTVEGYFAANPTVTSHTFGPYNFSGSINFNTSDPGYVYSDLGYAFGTVSISGQYSFTVSSTNYALTNVTYNGTFTDIYNFNYYRTDELGLNKTGAVVEAGYPNLGQGGFVFENEVNFTGSGSNTTIFGGTFDF